MNMNEIIKGVVLIKACSVKPDKDSKSSKTVNLRVEFDGVPLKAVFDKAMSSTVISWQTKARDIYNSLVDKGTVTIKFAAPATTAVDPVAAYVNYLNGLSPEDRAKAIAGLAAQAQK